MAIADQIIEQISQRLDIVSLIGEYVLLKPRGHSWWGCCPFHQEKTPSFSVNPDKKMFYCFGCHQGGSAFKFLMGIRKVSFVEAAEQLAQRVGVEIRAQSPAEREQLQHRQALEELYRRLGASFQHCLWHSSKGQEARLYLQQRGISPQLAQRYQLGYAPSDPLWLYRLLSGKGYSPAFLQESGLFSTRNPEVSLFVDRLLFPIQRREGQIIAFSGRQLGNHGPKYINSPNTPIYHKRNSLFGLEQAWPQLTQERHVFFCEGNFDVLALAEAGFAATLAPLGTALTLEQLRLLQRSVDRATLVFDADKAGTEALLKAATLLEQLDIAPSVVILDAGSDPAQTLLDEGAEALRGKIDQAVDFCQFFGQFIGSRCQSRRPEDVRAAARLAIPVIQAIPSALRAELYSQKIAAALGVSLDSLSQEMERGSANPIDNMMYHPSVSLKNTKSPKDTNYPCDCAEVELMLRIAAQPEVFAQWREHISQLGLGDTRALFLYNVLLSSEGKSWSEVLQQVESFNDRLAAQLTFLHFEPPAEATIEGTYLGCQRMSLEKQRQAVEERLTQLDLEQRSDWGARCQLLQERAELDEKLVRTAWEDSQLKLQGKSDTEKGA